MQATIGQDLRSSGIVGAGGAGFPTHLKYRRQTKMLIVNVQDSEPGYVKDKWLMLSKQDTLREGLKLLRGIFGFDQIVFAIKRSYETEFADLENSFEIFFTDDMYWNGEAKKLASVVLGMPLSTNRRTQDFNVTVNCLETVYNLCQWLLKGQPVTEKYVQVYGLVQEPKLFRAPIGTPAAVLLGLAGSETTEPENHETSAIVLSGGPMMGRVIDPATFTILKTTNDLFVAPTNFFERHSATTPTWRETPRQITNKLGLGSILDWHPSDNNLVDLTETVDRVVIDLHQSGRFGAANRSTVSAGQAVTRGELIASASDDIGADLHASISGFVDQVASDRIVLIKKHSAVRNTKVQHRAITEQAIDSKRLSEKALVSGMTQVFRTRLDRCEIELPRHLVIAIENALNDVSFQESLVFRASRNDEAQAFDEEYEERVGNKVFSLLGWQVNQRADLYPTGYKSWDGFLASVGPIFELGAELALSCAMNCSSLVQDNVGDVYEIGRGTKIFDDIYRCIEIIISRIDAASIRKRLESQLTCIKCRMSEVPSVSPLLYYEFWDFIHQLNIYAAEGSER